MIAVSSRTNRMRKMTPDELQTLKDLCEKATPGPWYSRYIAENDPMARPYYNFWYAVGPSVLGIEQAKKDSKFIATARESMPKIIEHIEQLELYISDLEHTVDVNGEFIKRVAEKKWRNGDLVIEAQECLKGEK